MGDGTHMVRAVPDQLTQINTAAKSPPNG